MVEVDATRQAKQPDPVDVDMKPTSRTRRRSKKNSTCQVGFSNKCAVLSCGHAWRRIPDAAWAGRRRHVTHGHSSISMACLHTPHNSLASGAGLDVVVNEPDCAADLRTSAQCELQDYFRRARFATCTKWITKISVGQ